MHWPRGKCLMRSIALLLGVLTALRAAPVSVAEPVVVQGVPQMGWAVNQPWQRISALCAALSAMGCPASYDELLVRSGAAFGLAWMPGRYSYAVIEVAPEDLVVNGARAVGARADHHSFPSKDEAWAALRESLDHGRPVVAWDGAGARVICGYDADGQRIHVQSNYTQGGVYKVQPLDSLDAPPPLQQPSDLVFLEYDPAAPMPDRDWPAILARAVRFADWPAEKELPGGLVYGLTAYDAWADTLRAGADEAGAEGDIRLLMPVTSMVAGARAAAAAVLTADVTLHEGFAEAVRHYRAEADLLKQMNDVLSKKQGGTLDELLKAMIANLAEADVREQAAQLIEAAKAEEVQAVDGLRKALKDLTPRETPPAQPNPPTPITTSPAEPHYQKGLELKRAGNLTSAADEFRAAVTADSKHLRAHYALAWVLKDLKDLNGAEKEFRKAIELAPDSPEAEDSKQALQRMGR